MIIGVTGFFASGKDTVAEYLVARKGFEHLSLSDIIRRRLREEGREVTIATLTEMGNAIRREKGPGALGEMAASSLTPGANTVVTSIRHPAEVEALRRAGHFTMLFVDVAIELRFERSRARARPGDLARFEDFQAAETAQMASADGAAQRLAECRGLADKVIINDSTLEALYRQIDDVLSEIGGRGAGSGNEDRKSGACH